MAYIGRKPTTNWCNRNTTTEVVKLEQNYLVLNDGEIGQGVDENQAGLIIERGQLPDALIRFNEDIKAWEYGIESDIKLLGKKAVKINSSTITKPSFVYLVDSTVQELSLLLPQMPKTGDEVEIIDLKGTFDLNNVIVLGNGSRIAGTNENAYLDVKFTNIRFVYVDFDIGWLLAPSNPITLSSNDIMTEFTTEQINNITTVVSQTVDETGPSIVNYILENPSTFVDKNHFNISETSTITLNTMPALNPGTYNTVTVNEKGLVTSAKNVVDKSMDLEIKSGSFAAKANKYYRLDTKLNTVSINLPVNPKEGDWIVISDAFSNFSKNSVTILYDGINTIRKNPGDLELDLDNTNVKLIYSNNNWITNILFAL